MAVDTAEDFFDVLEKSRLLTAEQLADARRSADLDHGAKAAAKALVRDDLLTRWQAGQLLAGRSSFFLGKYKLIEPIGRGGMGGVFLGQHTTMNRGVALKILSRQVGRDPASLERFLDEARAVAALDHPNIVQAYSVDHDADRYYLVMEYIDGRDLKRLVETEGLPDLGAAADYIRQAADGLAHGHGRNMIHCDVKPSNLLVNGQGVLKIVDMGLSRLNGRDREELNLPSAGHGTCPTQPSGGDANPLPNGRAGQQILGSVDYLAPEQALESADFDHRADVYSLGCTLYFLLTGHPPFPEGTLSERIVKHQMQQPRSIQSERRGVPASLVKICEKMMAKRPEDRFQSAEEVSRVLAEWRAAELKQQRSVPLKTAQPLEVSSGAGLPAINLGAKPGPSAAGSGDAGAAGSGDAGAAGSGDAGAAGRLNQTDRSKQGRVFKARRRKIAALVVAGLAVVVLAAACVAMLIGPATAPPQPKKTPARSGTVGTRQDGPADKPAANSGKPGGDHDETPADKPPTDQPPGDHLPADQPPPDRPEDDPPPADRPESEDPDKSQPEEPHQESREPGEEPPRSDGTDPFRRFPTAVDLPVVRASSALNEQPATPVSLGEIDLGPNAACEITLKGGKDAAPGKRQLELDRAPDNGQWLVHLDAEGKPETDLQRTDLARLWLEGQTLKFQWLGGVDRRLGDYLRNCGLLVGVGEQTRWLPLWRPKIVDPLLLDLDGGGARTSLPTADWMPRIEKLRVQVTGLEGPFPEHGFTPPDGISEDGRVEVLLSAETLPGVGLRVSLTGRGRAASVQLAAVYELVDQVPRPLKSREAFQLSGEFFALQKRSESTLEKLKNEDLRRPQLQRQVDLLKKSLEQLKALGDLYHQIHHAGKVHFRVFRPVEEYQIELFTTKTASPEDPGEEERPEDGSN